MRVADAGACEVRALRRDEGEGFEAGVGEESAPAGLGLWLVVSGEKGRGKKKRAKRGGETDDLFFGGVGVCEDGVTGESGLRHALDLCPGCVHGLGWQFWLSLERKGNHGPVGWENWLSNFVQNTRKV